MEDVDGRSRVFASKIMFIFKPALNIHLPKEPDRGQKLSHASLPLPNWWDGSQSQWNTNTGVIQ